MWLERSENDDEQREKEEGAVLAEREADRLPDRLRRVRTARDTTTCPALRGPGFHSGWLGDDGPGRLAAGPVRGAVGRGAVGRGSPTDF